MIVTRILDIYSEGEFCAINITDQVQEVIEQAGIKEGMALVYYRHTTGAIRVIEHEVGILVDLESALDTIMPVDGEYKHHLRGYDLNGAAHIRTAILGVSETIPFIDGRLMLGEYQEIILIDMDRGEKTRSVVVQVMGD
jgi:secondary thiamine-phosphate synthase enzyme